MQFTPKRLAWAAAFVFLLLTLRPLLVANPDSACHGAVLFEAFKSKSDEVRGFGWSASASAGKRCIDDAQAQLVATATRLAFFGVLGAGVAMILGWRPARPLWRQLGAWGEGRFVLVAVLCLAVVCTAAFYVGAASRN